MRITPFKIDDLGAFMPNEFSNPDEVFPMLMGMEVQTMWGDDGLVQAFLCVKNYWGRCWVGFILVSENFDRDNVLRLRALIEHSMTQRNAQRLETTSQSCERLTKWHKLLGFTHEGTKRKMMFDRDYDMWAIVREGA